MFNTATSASSSSSASSSARNAGPPSNLAKQYDADKERLVKSCFSKVDEQNQRKLFISAELLPLGVQVV